MTETAETEVPEELSPGVAESTSETTPRNVSRGLPEPEQLMTDILNHRGWDVREGQRRMVEVVAGAIESDYAKTGVSVNAPTGTGKTLGYLIGSLPSDQRVVICTSTKALQNQIVYSELPKLQSDLKGLYGYDLTFSMVKGRSNYLCLYRAEALLEGISPDDDDTALFAELAEEMSDEVTKSIKSMIADVRKAMENGDATYLDMGDRLAELPPSVRSQINGSTGCPACREKWWEQADEDETPDADDGHTMGGQSQPEREPIPLDEIIATSECAYRSAYAHSLNSDIVVINTSLLAAEIMKGRNVWEYTPQLLMGAGIVIVDEAHHLTRIMTEALRMTFDFDDIATDTKTYFRRIGRIRTDLDDDLQFANTLVEQAHDEVIDIVDNERSRRKVREKVSTVLFKLSEEIEQLSEMTNRPARDLDLDEKAKKSIAKSLNKINSEVLGPITLSAMALIDTVEDPETQEMEYSYDVSYAGGDKGDAEDAEDYWLRIELVPLDLSGTRDEIADLNLRRNLYSDTSKTLARPLQNKSVMILCSGTITSEAAFVIGMKGDKHHKVPSPFDYTACRLFVPSDMPNPNDSDWRDEAWEVAKDAINKAGGRAMFLTTSYYNLNYFVERALEELTMNVIYQGDGNDRSELLRIKSEDETSVLFGTTSFWEGVDIPGRALSLVIMDKIMFPVKDDPVFSARRKWVEKHDKNPFMHVDVDQAAVMFAQGFGRQIRSVEDRGGVICLDSRVTENKYYGSSVTKIIPAPTPVTSSQDAFSEWIEWAVNSDKNDEIPEPDMELWRPLRIQRPKRGTRRKSRVRE